MGDPNNQDPKGEHNDPHNGGNQNEPGRQSIEGGKPDDNIKALQQKLSAKDVELKNAQAELERIKTQGVAGNEEAKKLIEGLQKQIEGLTGELGAINREKQMKALTEQYPDIMPEFLIGRNEEEIKGIVEKQRVKNRELYGDSTYFSQPTYRDSDAVQKDIDAITADKKLSAEQKAIKILELNRLKTLFKK